jgi:transcriptional regulator with XRE-family HTH domain
MSETLALSDVVFDRDIYPRAEWSQATVNRYAEALNAGDVFPPIELEAGTNRLLGGMHRLQAHKQALRTEISVVWTTIPDGIPAKLYTASLSTKHGDRMSGDDLRAVAREVCEANPEFDMKVIAKFCNVTRQTVSKWVGNIIEHRRAVRKLCAMILARAGWSQRQIADLLGVSQKQVSDDVNADIYTHLTEELLREAVAALPDSVDAEAICEELRQEQIFATWSDDERELLRELRTGETIVVSLRGEHNNLIEWADSAGLYMRIDRRTDWGNPFEMGKDGDRDTVIANYENHYLPHKPSLLGALGDLRGMALGCWCAPEPCHGDVLAKLAGQ